MGKASYESLVCLGCGLKFKRRSNQELHNRRAGKVGPFCGRVCAGRRNADKGLRTPENVKEALLLHDEGNSFTVIGRYLKCSRTTVRKWINEHETENANAARV